jgi:glucose-1-phosphate adenylyltransferase
MPKPKVLALVMAGGEGSRLEVLTERRARPALPYAGVYRLIDFPLSNCVHSGIEDVWVLQQYRLQSLNDQLANGRPWDLDRTYGGLRLLPPQLGAEEDGFHEGNADAIWRNRVTVVTSEVPEEDASRQAVVEVDGDGRFGGDEKAG